VKLLARLAGAFVLIVCIAAPVRSQTPDAGPAIRVAVDLVQVDAVVTDAKGCHIADLKPEDFQIFEDGKPQKITHFSFIGAKNDRSASFPSAPSAPTQERNAPATTPVFTGASPAPPRRSEIHRTLVLFTDDLGLSSDAIPYVRTAMKSFVDREMQPGDLVSIMTSSGGMGATAGLTSDKRQIYASIDRIRYVPGRNGFTWYPPVHKIDAASEFENQANARLNAIRHPFLGAGTMTALSYAIQGLREMPGRKAIALFSDGIPPARGLIELANRASVVIYALDPRGVASFFLTGVDWCSKCNPSAEEGAREKLYRDSQASLETLARATGGLFIHDRNDLDQGLAAALDDMGSYYLIGYQPHRGDFDLDRGRPRYHRIEVKVVCVPACMSAHVQASRACPTPPPTRRPGLAKNSFGALSFRPFRRTVFRFN
jgi:VWFA-related protein